MSRVKAKTVILKHGDSPPAGVTPTRHFDIHGYVNLRWRVSNLLSVQCLEHRWVMGLPPAHLQVHHINHDRRDNRPENLVALTAAEHGAAHRRIDGHEAERLYGLGYTTMQIGEIMGFDHSSIYRTLFARGVRLRKARDLLRADLPDDDVVSLYLAGANCQQIATALGVSRGLIRNRLHERGVVIRRPGPPTAAEVARGRQAIKDAGYPIEGVHSAGRFDGVKSRYRPVKRLPASWRRSTG